MVKGFILSVCVCVVCVDGRCGAPWIGGALFIGDMHVPLDRVVQKKFIEEDGFSKYCWDTRILLLKK